MVVSSMNRMVPPGTPLPCFVVTAAVSVTLPASPVGSDAVSVTTLGSSTIID
jgi:hypothetical protein